jgi:hypothetical protein
MARLLAPSLCACPSVLGCHTASLGCHRSMRAIPSLKTFVEVEAPSQCEAQRVAAGRDVEAEDQQLRQTESAAGTGSHTAVRAAPGGSAFRRVSLAEAAVVSFGPVLPNLTEVHLAATIRMAVPVEVCFVGIRGLLEHLESDQIQWSGTRRGRSCQKILSLSSSVGLTSSVGGTCRCLQTPLCCGLTDHDPLQAWPADPTFWSFSSCAVQRGICCPLSFRLPAPVPQPRMIAESRRRHYGRSSSSLGIPSNYS